MAEYIELSAQEKSVFTKQEEEKQYWFDWLKQFRATKEYPIKETAVDNFLRGYGEAVQHMLSVNEQLLFKSADVVEVVHGYWEFNCGQAYGEPLYFCSVCTDGGSEWGKDKYCPNCGAKMDGERRSE